MVSMRMRSMRRALIIAALLSATSVLLALPASATVGKGLLFHDGAVVGTVVVPVQIPGQGTDPFYVVTNGVSGQLGIAGVAPGDGPYHGGEWEVFTVTFTPGASPSLLSSDEEVFAAVQAGDATITRSASADFR